MRLDLGLAEVLINSVIYNVPSKSAKKIYNFSNINKASIQPHK